MRLLLTTLCLLLGATAPATAQVVGRTTPIRIDYNIAIQRVVEVFVGDVVDVVFSAPNNGSLDILPGKAVIKKDGTSYVFTRLWRKNKIITSVRVTYPNDLYQLTARFTPTGLRS